MKLSKLLTKTTKDVAANEVSKNAILLTQAGYVDKLAAGVYSFLPLGHEVIQNVSKIVREELNAAGAQEIYMPALHPKANWSKTGRWDKVDILFKTKSRWGSNEYCLGPTHEEVVVPLVGRFVQSYKDLPAAVYQIQTKFRDEARAKSGLLRGREFLMKDLYSFHATEGDRAAYYEKMIEAYKRIFKRCGFEKVLVARAGGGSFTDKHSHEFQVITEAGEDTIFYCDCDCGCDFADNAEVWDNTAAGELLCTGCGHTSIKQGKSIEVGNIFDLGVKFSKDFDLYYTDKDGKKKPVIIGCYGIGISRLMGALVEQLSDDRGLVWPKEVAPYDIYLTYFKSKKDDYREELPRLAEILYKQLQTVYDGNLGEIAGKWRILFDDREKVSNGRKLADADLLGIPHRLILSEKTMSSFNFDYGDGEYGVEYRARTSKESKLIGFDEFSGEGRDQSSGVGNIHNCLAGHKPL
jgi:prolyl-tRNA synthetase